MLRSSGSLEAEPQSGPLRSAIVLIGSALIFGAVIYLGAVFGAPALMKAMEKQPVPVSYAKPN